LLPPDRCNDYLVRLARNEPGLSRLLVRELRELGQGKTSTTPSTGERVAYAVLVAESKAMKAQLERERREQERLARLRHLQEIHDHQDVYWRQVDKAVTRFSSAGYDEAARLLVELREAAAQFQETQKFQTRFSTWVRSYLRRPAFIRRLQERQFTLPEA
jgi:chorismate mutase